MLKAALNELGWSKAQLARKLGLDPHTVSGWGEEPPEYAVAYLELALALRRTQDGARAALADTVEDRRGRASKGKW